MTAVPRRPRRAGRWAAGETRVVAVATALALVHAVDEALVHRERGVGVGQHALAALAALAVGLAGVAAFPLLRPGLRAAVALVFGVLALVNGGLHVLHAITQGPAGSDWTGFLAAAAGAVLLATGVSIPWRHRGEAGGGRGRRWGRRAVAVVGGALALYAVVFPVSIAVVQTHPRRESVGDPPRAAYRSVSFDAADGLALSGWYMPSRNGAAVIVVHGGGSDRRGSVEHAELLARHGYGVLLYDARGRGRSEGSPNAFGWRWERDVAGALAFVLRQRDVGRGRVAGLGLSTGADVLIGVAARDRRLRAVVGDGATAASFADYRALAGLGPEAPFFLSMTTAARVFSGEAPNPRIVDDVRRVSPTPLLLVASGQGVAGELEMNRLYAREAREPFEFWELPDVNHTSAIRERAAEYERRVVGFLDAALR